MNVVTVVEVVFNGTVMIGTGDPGAPTSIVHKCGGPAPHELQRTGCSSQFNIAM